jgi:hypothetical protein
MCANAAISSAPGSWVRSSLNLFMEQSSKAPLTFTDIYSMKESRKKRSVNPFVTSVAKS